ncbi:hypothetical protein [Kitasatospora cheerisanensis]|uniref:Uncharacterized protein n=1 Tax=Kitasatospora cheerisanensis KCTC 2395 TaxID=1348663 RepID=A0A066ZD74_9ACTN|nr:hypothetical protein [Kitasatospora cheerisanensis]KDN88095.1 hypothetical protein KCH_01720 [Kitasatospora cheerisanensis KCTC 2395]
MRTEVRAFVADGPLPDRDSTEEEIDRRCAQLDAIARPVTGEEAHALAACFGPDDCYGVAWTLVHLVETAPGPVPAPPRTGAGGAPVWDVVRHRWGGREEEGEETG